MPDWKPLLRARLGELSLRPERLADVVEELTQHLDERYDELCAVGHPAAEAERRVREEAESLALPERLQRLRQARQPQPPDPPPMPATGGRTSSTICATRCMRCVVSPASLP